MNRLHASFAPYWQSIQHALFPQLEHVLGPLTAKQQQLVQTLEVIRIERWIPGRFRVPGRPPKDRAAIARALVAKAVYDMPTTRVSTAVSPDSGPALNTSSAGVVPPLVADAVDAGRGHRRGRIHRPDVAPAEVVGENDHRVRRRAGRGPRTGPGRPHRPARARLTPNRRYITRLRRATPTVDDSRRALQGRARRPQLLQLQRPHGRRPRCHRRVRIAGRRPPRRRIRLAQRPTELGQVQRAPASPPARPSRPSTRPPAAARATAARRCATAAPAGAPRAPASRPVPADRR